MDTEARLCQNCREQFVIEPEDSSFYEKISVPPPTFCPECRMQRRMAFRNERTLYKRKCDLCGEVKVSCFRPGTRFPVYCPTCWWSDKWDPMSYGIELDFSRPFLDQFNELRNRVPQQGLFVAPSTMKMSDFCHMADDLKDCYMVTHANDDENCFYSSGIIFSRDSGELLSCRECELCLEDVQCRECNRVFFSLDCESCHNLAFSSNCVGCSDCFGCANLKNKQYCVWNEQYSREEYLKKIAELDLGSWARLEEYARQARDHWKKYPQKFMHGRHNVGVSGEYVYDSKNSGHCYIVSCAEDSKFCSYITDKPIAQCYDYMEWGFGAELVYECVNVGGGVSGVKFSQMCWGNCKNFDYAHSCVGSSDLFGCVSLRNKQYCILNKQYAEEEYKELRKKIIKHMMTAPYIDAKRREYRYGEFLPVESSFWGYNETTAQEYFPLTKEEASGAGYFWSNIEEYKGKYEPALKAEDIPDKIEDAEFEVCGEIMECGICRRAYRVILQEFEFYKNQKIALPRACPECRYRNRFRQRNSFRLRRSSCMCEGTDSGRQAPAAYRNVTEHFHGKEKCPNEFMTAYAPDSGTIVYCEDCYNSETA